MYHNEKWHYYMAVSFRPLQRNDYAKGIMNVLGQLTTVGNVTWVRKMWTY